MGWWLGFIRAKGSSLMGTEGGSGGGQVIAEGTPEHVASLPHSHTGRFLAKLLAENAAERLQRAWDKPALGAAERGELALLIAEARVASARAALEISSQVFEAMGARASASRYGFDRFWRNVRVHSLHDPLDYKVRDIGQWLTRGVAPTPSLYS